MSRPPFSGRPASRALIALALAAAMPVLAQYPGGAVVQPLPAADDPAERLAAALRTLAVSPHDLAALIEAGRDALALGDPNAAVGFFGRANEVSPRDGRIKAGLGAALVQLEKPRDALRYFQEAGALGVPDVDLAGDRGLAYDLVGDPPRAQHDYQTVLAAHPDDDAARRRLALSQGISGDRKAAIATLDPLIRKRDIAAWRAQTFVLAMTGDTKGANDITRIMLPQQQAMLQPFLERLATLSPGDKARAVNFGEMPPAGRSYSAAQLASIGTPATYAPVPPAPAPVIPRPIPIAPPAPAPIATRPPVPAAGPARSTSTAPGIVSAGRERFVSPDGAPMRRIEHSAQEQMALGLPRYEYVPIAEAPRHVPAAPAPVMVAAVTPQQPALAPRLTAPATPAGSSAIRAEPEAVATVAVSPAMAATPTAPAAPPPVTTAAATPIPLGASASEGHFDVPHGSADRRPIPHAVQSSARPPAAVTTSPARVAIAEPAPAGPTVTSARHGRGGTGITAADPPVRVGHARSVTSSDQSVAAPAEKPVKDIEAERRRHGDRSRAADSPATRDVGDEDKARDRRGDHGERTRTASRDDDADTGVRPHGKAKPDEKAEFADKAKADGKSRHGEDRGAEKKSERDADKGDKSTGGKIYVQVAGGANREDMDRAWAGVKAKAPELMRGHTPSTTPLKATNRLLVGPFKSDEEAQAFVNKMAGKGLSGFTFRSSKGQKVDKIDNGK